MKKHAFTLVELIVAITIFSILSTIAYVGFQGHITKSRDSVRILDVATLNKNFDLFYLNSSIYPDPDSYFNISYSGIVIWKQGSLGTSVGHNLSSLNKIPIDPLFSIPYTYSVDANNQSYQLGTITENVQ